MWLMSGSVLGEVVGAHADLGGGLRPAQSGWTEAMLTALPTAAAERRALYEPVMIAPVAPPAGADPATLAACLRFAASALSGNATFAPVSRIDGLQWLLGARDAEAFARAAIERLGELGPQGGRGGESLEPRWSAVLAATTDLTAAYLRYQQVLPQVGRAIMDPAVAEAVRGAAGAAHAAAAAVLDAPPRLADRLDGAELARIGDELDVGLAAVTAALGADAGAATAVIAEVRAAIAPWRDACGGFATALAAARTTASARGQQLDAAAGKGDERWQVVAVSVATVREGLAAMRAARAAWTTPPGIDPAMVAAFASARAPLEDAAARLESLYGAVDAAASAVWG